MKKKISSAGGNPPHANNRSTKLVRLASINQVHPPSPKPKLFPYWIFFVRASRPRHPILLQQPPRPRRSSNCLASKSLSSPVPPIPPRQNTKTNNGKPNEKPYESVFITASRSQRSPPPPSPKSLASNTPRLGVTTFS